MSVDPRQTLYVSDLDGTLLRSDGSLSPYSVRTLNRLIGEGMPFTVASARGCGEIRYALQEGCGRPSSPRTARTSPT